MNDILERCSALAVSPARAPPPVRERLRAQLLTVIAASFRSSEEELTAWARRSTGPHPLIPLGVHVARMESIVAGVARARGGEWGVIGRTGGPSVITALSLGAAADRTVADLERAQLAGVELGLRFGLATLRPRPAIAAAMAAARILDLDVTKTTEALRGALAGQSALDGVIAAEHAFEGRRFAHDEPLAPGAFAQLNERWLASTIQIEDDEAIDEVFAQARAVRRAPLSSHDVRELFIESTIFDEPDLRGVTVRHAWDLTSAALFRVAETIDLRSFFGAVGRRELAVRLARLAERFDVPPIGQIAADVTRLFSLRSRGFDPHPIMLGRRVHLTTRDGQRFSADRSEPAVQTPERALAIAHQKLVEAAGSRRATRIHEALRSPTARISELVTTFESRG